MESCDVLVIGGGPAGSTCAWKLKKAGLDVLLLDKQHFPRDKPCAGWITPAVLQALEIDIGEYSKGRVLEQIRNFRTGGMDGPETLTRYGKVVSYGIRRYEFDDYLLRRSEVLKILGEPVVRLERRQGGWLVNGRIAARMLVGAGGHFCPAARFLGAKVGKENAVVARVAECRMPAELEPACPVSADTPELYFCRDMKGYGWVMRKGRYLNVGLGRLDRDHLTWHTEEFIDSVEKRLDLPPPGLPGRFRGHAYLLSERPGRRRIDDGILLAGDAAGLSYRQSGEGILPAVESGLMAAQVILEAAGDYRRKNLEPYAAKLAARFDGGKGNSLDLLPSRLIRFVGARLLATRWFTRSILLDRWFLHADLKVPGSTSPLVSP